MTEAEIDNVLDLLDAFADERGGGREQACFHAARVIRQLRAELDDMKGDAEDRAYGWDT